MEKSFEVNPSHTYNIWDELYKAIRQGKKYPIKINQAIEVMKVISQVKEGTQFYN